jgi:ubiquinone/menaquinone biosynthesis C-methylase UbiE
MLTLFPRIRANPLPPPPPETPEEKDIPAAASTDEIGAPFNADEVGSSDAVESTGTAESTDAATADEGRILVSVASDSEISASPEKAVAQDSSADFTIETIERLSLHVEETDEAEPSAKGDQVAPPEESSAAVLARQSLGQSVEQSASDERLAVEEEPVKELEPSGLVVAATNIFDELEILHEAAAESAPESASEAAGETEPKVTPAETAPSAPASAEEAQEPASVESLDSAPFVIEIGDAWAEAKAAETAAVESASTAPQTEDPASGAVSLDEPQAPVHEEAAVSEIAVEPASAPAQDGPPPEASASQEAPATEASEAEVLAATPGDAASETPAIEAVEEVAATAATEPVEAVPEAQSELQSDLQPVARSMPAKPKRSKESFFELERVPEPESMDDSAEVEAYASAAAQAHLDAIDDTFVAHAQLLLKGRERGRALDIGTGPGQIVIKLGYRLTRWKFVGVDCSQAMIETARASLASAPEVAGRVEFRVADGNHLDFPNATFDLVVCNSVLHHIAEPQNLFSEIARVVKPGGAILLRDLVRPPRFSYGSHIRKNARHYKGEMRRLYIASVQAAYTEEEMQKLVDVSALRGARVFRHGKTHIGVERPLGAVVV